MVNGVVAESRVRRTACSSGRTPRRPCLASRLLKSLAMTTISSNDLARVSGGQKAYSYMMDKPMSTDQCSSTVAEVAGDFGLKVGPTADLWSPVKPLVNGAGDQLGEASHANGRCSIYVY